MKVVCSFFVASFFVLGAYGWARSEYSPAKDPMLKGLKYDCIPTEFNISPMKGNEVKYVTGNDCVRVKCRSEGIVEYLGCLIPNAPENCTVQSGQPDKQYPDCCETVVC